MNPATLFDPSSFAIVVGGTVLATALRCGITNCRIAIGAMAQIGRPGFDAAQTRAELAVQIRAIQRDGLLRAQPHHFGDREFEDETAVLLGTRSVAGLVAAHEAHKTRRLDLARRAATTFAQACELAPAFGLAGTLIALTQLPAGGIARDGYSAAISMAVLSTLYGILLANILLAPLARVIERAANAEEAQRQSIVEWLTVQVEACGDAAEGRLSAVRRTRGKPVVLVESI
jgi:chemotaxis protein MotA